MTTLRQAAKRVLPPQTIDWLRKRRKPAQTPAVVVRDPGPTEQHLIGLETMLWMTGDAIYADKLARFTRLTSSTSRARWRGSMAIARWHVSQDRPDEALQVLEGVRTGDPDAQAEVNLLRVDCFFALDRAQAALSLLSRMTRRGTNEQNLLLRVGRARALLGTAMDHGSGPAIEALNSVYRSTGFRMVRRNRVTDAVAIENLVCEVPVAEPRESLPLVTVVIPVGDGETGGYSGVGSLLKQSWGNLEVLAVGNAVREWSHADEVSTAVDGRVEFIEADKEEVWPAALGRASGEFVTGHAFGAWAHPQRIEIQATTLLGDPFLRATVSSHMRVDSELTPRPLLGAPRPRLVGPNTDSTMVRRVGRSPEAVLADMRSVIDAFSQVTGTLGHLPDVEVVDGDTPLTLTPYERSSASSVAVPV